MHRNMITIRSGLIFYTILIFATIPGTGVMATLLQEIISVYPQLSPPTLTGHASNRVCNALALLQCVASHQETRGLFLNGEFAIFYFFFKKKTILLHFILFL